MTIGVIGDGMVGGACIYGFRKLGHKVKIYDPYKHPHSKIEDLLGSSIIYVCVPTNANSDGSCDVSIATQTLENLHALQYKGIIAIKSTVEPGYTEKMANKFKGEMKICFVPEFLRERCAISDFTEHHDLLAVGTDDISVYNQVVKCHGKYPKHTVQLSYTEAELLKYYSNVFNALRVIFANEMYEICQAINANYQNVKDAFMLRGTATDMYMDVNDDFRGYAGYCLPKDTKALAFLVERLSLDLNLFKVIDEENQKFKPTVFPGMRLSTTQHI